MENLVILAKQGDHAAFSNLIRQHTQSMYKISWAYLKNDEDVADAIQETILVCYEKLHTLRENKYFKTWLIRILINNCNDILRQNRRIFPTIEFNDPGYEESGYQDCEWKELLTCLDEKYQLVLLLYYSKTLTVKEIAELLNINSNTVLSRLARGREQLKHVYENGGIING